MLLICLALMLGILVDYVFSIQKLVSLSLVIAGCGSWIGLGHWHPFQHIDQAKITSLRSAIILTCFAAIGCAWHHTYWNDFAANEIGFMATSGSQPCAVELRLCSEPQYVASQAGFGIVPPDLRLPRGNMQTRFRATALRIRDGKEWLSSTGNVELVIHQSMDHLQSGDRVRIFGRLVRPAPPTNPGQFDFSRHYRRQRLLAFVHVYHASSVQLLDRSSWAPTRILSVLRRQLDRLLWQNIGHRQAAFASAILLGNRRQMEKSRRDKFVETGTAHLLAISGLHVGILAGAFMLLLRGPFVRRRWCLLTTIGFVLFYAWLVEFRPPATRAAILIVLYCWARLLGEKGVSINLLATAAIIVLVINPTDLFSVGPQMSFLAVTTLALGKDWIFPPPPTDPLQRLIANTRSTPVRWLQHIFRVCKMALLVSLAIWLVALPLVANRFHIICYLSPLINPVLLPPITIALYLGLTILAIGGFVSPIAKILGYLCDRNLSLIEWIVGGTHRIGWSYDWTAGPSNWATGVFYSGLALLMIWPIRQSRGWVVILFAASWFIFGWWLPQQLSQRASPQTQMLECTFIDVGHGTSVLIQFPNREHWLYDAGALGSASYGASNIASTLWYNQIEDIDTLVISHADADHYNAVLEIADKFSIGRVLISQPSRHSNSSGFNRLIDHLNHRHIPIVTTHQGMTWPINSDCRVSILSPIPTGFSDGENADSLVLVIDNGPQRILLPGDLEKSGLEHLLKQPKLDCDLIMAAHHGSANSDPQAMMDWSTPEWVVISSRRSHSSDAAARLFTDHTSRRQVLQTHQLGAIRFQLDGDRIVAEHWQGTDWEAVEPTKIGPK